VIRRGATPSSPCMQWVLLPLRRSTTNILPLWKHSGQGLSRDTGVPLAGTYGACRRDGDVPLRERTPLPATTPLGVVTIVGFGVWFFDYDVLLEPISEDTGWSEAVLSSTNGLSLPTGSPCPARGCRRRWPVDGCIGAVRASSLRPARRWRPTQVGGRSRWGSGKPLGVQQLSAQAEHHCSVGIGVGVDRDDGEFVGVLAGSGAGLAWGPDSRPHVSSSNLLHRCGPQNPGRPRTSEPR
jgi:hypothetical protein